MINYTGTYTDQYQLTMAQAYFKQGKADDKAVFDYFFRKLPFDSGYAVFAGLNDLLDILEQLHFDKKEIDYLKGLGFSDDFLDFLKNFRFRGKIFSSSEGDIVFPTRPVLQVEATIIEAQLIETLLLNVLNFQTLIATKASRMKLIAGEKQLVDFGLRRAQAAGGYYASKAAVAGGFNATSNVRAGMDFNIPVSGTMAHSFIQSYDDELSAFRAYAASYPDDCVLLVDTYDTLKSGVPNAIKTGKELEKKGHKLKGIRLDSGDLAYMAKESRRQLDEAGLDYVKIAASNQLDEQVIKSLMEQNAPIDFFGVGTSLVTGNPDAALDGVYKLSYAGGKPRLKLSENVEKITLPHKKQVYRLIGTDGNFLGGDLVSLRDEEDIEEMFHPHIRDKSMNTENCQKEALLKPVMEHGKRLKAGERLDEIAEFSQSQLKKLPDEYKRFTNPHIYKIGISKALQKERNKLIEAHNQ
ncbi:MAG: nicotinate phosphoribosyltransferase [Bacteroidales bacterium]